jgi:1-deoxy-D-xylulose-5-phosphate reductoisomerase
MGISGLAPTYKAIECGRDIALANKETLVAGGALVTDLCREKGVRLLPVDSEHSAIFQCLEGNGGSACGRAYREYEEGISRPVRRILLTASGGPFRGRSLEEMRDVTIEQALNHPKWSMGSKITIDSATMMNKGLEVIEARWLFDVPAEKIDVHVHPESIVHSMVEFCDGSVMAQLGLPDMKIPISLALNYPDRMKLIGDFDPEAADAPGAGALDLFTTGANLTFEKPDRKVFRCIDLAYAALKEGGAAPVVMNGANEALVAMFLAGKIGFLDIPETIEKVMNAADFAAPATVDEILHIDRESRELVSRFI